MPRIIYVDAKFLYILKLLERNRESEEEEKNQTNISLDTVGVA
jgi:hypothetical protein